MIMERQTDIAQTIELAADRARYDECAKKLLTYKAVIAWILKSCTKEFSQYSVKFICDNCLNENVELSEHAVHQDQLNRDERLNGDKRLDGLNTEANAVKDQTVYYDIRFKATLPESKEPVQLIITVFTDEHYEKIQKVYSIWICPDPAKKRKNGIFRYHTVEDSVRGNSFVKSEAYDLMEVVILNLGDADESSDLEILDLLNVLFSTTATPEEKKKRLNDEFDIAMTAEFESEVRDMCNLSKALVEQGIEQGIERGIEQGIGKGIEQKNLSLAKMMIEGNEPIDKIAKYTGYGIDRIKEIAEQMKTPVSV